jgi:rubrerythrin
MTMAVSKKTLDGLSRGIQAELAAYVFYKKAIEVSTDNRIIDILQWLANEEKDHYKLLEHQYDSLVRSEIWVTYNDIMRQPGLPNLDEKMEDVHTDYIDEVDEDMTAKRMLEIGLALEKRAKDLYTELGNAVDDPMGKETYAYLVRFETGHMAKIQAMMKEMGYA